ncbi:restriction endonuclease subunit S [Algiphilus sp.]|uniref:restriction endonuclease subunit S n=1 Tax=Algiphilus sp. TaxID=1872431 RepID=UPI0032ECB084
MSFVPYPNYKDSGNKAVGLVPEHWPIKRLRFVAEINPSKSEVAHWPDSTEVGFFPMEAVGDDHSLSNGQRRELAELRSGYTYFREGDVTFAKITPCFENGKGALMRPLPTPFGFGSTELTVLRGMPEHLDERFLYMLTTSEPFRSYGEASMYGAGGQKRVPDDFVRDFVIGLPDTREQNRIVAFLDHETDKIDALVEEQKRLIALLKEKRQAVISHAVTKGLDPNVPMKDSGVEWLGHIPHTWKTTRLKHLSTAIVDCPHETPIYNSSGKYFVIRTADIERGTLESTQMYRVTLDQYLSRTRRSKLQKNDIVYGREGERWGHAALVPESDKFCLGQRMMQFSVNNTFDADYVMWQLNSANIFRQGETDTVGATSPHVNVETIRNFRMAAPPLAEQKAIGSYLRNTCARIDSMMESASGAIHLLAERRSALISAAVTGKIDVRNWMPSDSSADLEQPLPMAAETPASYG